MITFTISLLALVAGYILYGRFVERIVSPDNRTTPAVSKADGVDFIVLPNWKIFMIQFLNIAGTGPIFGAIMGAKFGPAAYLWIVFGCIFAGAVHDYLSGMLSMRNGGAGLPELTGKYLGKHAKQAMLVFSVLMLILVGTVFVYSPADILKNIYGDTTIWIMVIFAYYVLATLLPIDKIISKVYPLFAFSLLFMAVAIMVCLYVKMPQLPELWEGIGNMGREKLGLAEQIFPCLFITIACGAISGFHATQSPLMARCIGSEKQGRPIFYGAMITEGIVALVWATASMYFFYNDPVPGYEQLSGVKDGMHTSAPAFVNIICKDWLGMAGGILALLGVVAAPITSGDTAFRSARLIVADFLHIGQKSMKKRFYICIPMFMVSILFLFWQIENPDGFNIVWQYFGWANQTLAVFTLWTITVYLVRERKPYIITLIPSLFMTTVCFTFLLISKQALGLDEILAYSLGGVVFVVSLAWFLLWLNKEKDKMELKNN